VPELEPRVQATLGLVAVGVMFDNYDLALLNAALKQIAESLAIAPGDTGWFLAAIRLGGLGTFALVPVADRVGRRRVFLAALVGMSVGTLASGLAPTAAAFVLCQIATRACLLTVSALAVVFLVEELPAAHRGWGIGVLTLMGGLGYGLGAALYAAVDLLPFGWRTLYAAGFLPAALLPLFRRELRETRRFEGERAARGGAPGGGLLAYFASVASLVRGERRRALGIGLAGGLGAMGGLAFYQYASYFAQAVHGWAPGHYSALVLGGGFVGVAGSVVGGRAADRVGRRKLGLGALLLAPAAAALYYQGPGWALPLGFAGFVFFASAGDVVVRAMSGELFPTDRRGAATGWLILVQTAGFALGLALVGLGTREAADLSASVPFVSLALAAGGLSLLLLPETGRRELEAISPPQRGA
jgi:DHA1 family putative efflux transporter-like MFS transporter